MERKGSSFISPSQSKRILLIDDEKDLVEELTLRLEATGWVVLAAFDGQEGLEKARQEKPDLILLDVVMPKIKGYQVCRELKGNPGTKVIVILMLSAKAQESDKYRGMESGADDYITKPFDMGNLMQKIEYHLKNGRTQMTKKTLLPS